MVLFKNSVVLYKIRDITQVNIQQNHENLSKMIEESKVSDLNMNRRNEVRTIPQIQNQAHPIDNLKTTDKCKMIIMYSKVNI